jgi:hypothetical protein
MAPYFLKISENNKYSMSVFSFKLVHNVEENKKIMLKSWIRMFYSKINKLILLCYIKMIF